MSNEDINNASASTEVIDPIIENGQVDETGEAQAETPEQELELFDYTEIADKVIKLQVDGEEVVVPVKGGSSWVPASGGLYPQDTGT